jgi:4-alpha-glucanotransferase
MPAAKRPRPAAATRRVVGVTVPLFSLRSDASWGIGEIGDLPAFAALVARAGVKLVQLLPLAEISLGGTSPYSALSAFGIDPMYISLIHVSDLRDLSNDQALGHDGAARLGDLRRRPGVDYDAVRPLKRRALAAGLEVFHARELTAGTARSRRARSFVEFLAAHRDWLPDYAIFRAIKDAHRGAAWWDWPEPLRDRDPAAMRAAQARHAEAVLLHEYSQWLAHAQWSDARAALRDLGVELMGDLPFMVDRDSADVWANRDQFRLDMSVGCPADQFDPDGQDWGLPPYDWKRMAADGFAWLRRRARYAGTLYDRFRIDHLVGFFRTYMRPYDRRRDDRGKLLPGAFDPADAAAQRRHGEKVVGAMIASAAEVGARLIAEDLGSIPDYVAPALKKLGAPGYKVLQWERARTPPGKPAPAVPDYADPAGWPAQSVACFGTHDTAPVATWWSELGQPDRDALLKLPVLRDMSPRPGPAFTPAVHAALLHLLCGAGSDLVLLLLQDVLGTGDRINVPGTVGPHNWTYRLPHGPDVMARDPAVQAALARLHAAISRAGR